MGKFSDLPHFLLDDYFSQSIDSGVTATENTEITGSYLHGQRTSIVAEGGIWTKMWIDVKEVGGDEPEYPGFVEYKFKAKNTYRDGDNFNFELGSLLTLPASANGTFDSGSDVYFKKESYMYEWLVNNSSYSNYFNTNKTWLYFGKIYQTDNVNGYRIIFDGMKNFVMNAIPRHQRTDNLTEFMDISFDKVYQQIYNMTKDVFSLIDPREVNINWIEYLANAYGMDIDVNLTGLALREWVENLVYLLKRKGTYTSLYIIWKTLLENTTNDLNIYNRWHVADLYSTFGIRYPLGHFYDILHQMEYGLEPVGCSGKNWYERVFDDIATSDIWHQATESLVWKTKHQMYTKTMVVQCYNESYQRIWPSKIEVIDTGLIEITFGVACTGYAFLESSPDYLHSQGGDSIEWSIAHNSAEPSGVISQYSSLVYNIIMPENINLYDENLIDVDFGTATDGYGIILSDNLSVVTCATPSASWTMRHNLGSKEVLVQSFDTQDNMIQSNNLKLMDDNSCLLTWTTPTSGYIIARAIDQEETLPSFDLNDKIMSPHYKVEIDLSCEPLDNDATIPSILAEETIDRLVSKWEIIRPVTRYSHYHELISPVTDFKGQYVSLYGGDHNAFLLSKYCASASEFIPDLTSDTMLYQQNSNASTWTISHNMDTKNVIVQCWDYNNRRIWPNIIQAKYDDTILIDFDVAVRGTASIVTVPPSGSIHTQSSVASTWSVIHSRSLKEVISQYDIQNDTSLENYKAMPSDITLSNDNNLISSWTTYNKGLGVISDSEIIWAESTAKTSWIIDHRMGSDSVIVQFFDDDDKMIQPSSIILSTSNRCIATFPNNQSGYAVLRSVNKAFTEATIMSNIINGGYWMLGEGTSGSDYNPITNNSVQSMLVSGSTFDDDSDDDMYYLDFEIGQQTEDWDITEIAWFDKYNKIRFYSYFSPIHKPKDNWFNSHYRITRSQT
jgi:hypothetical protein